LTAISAVERFLGFVSLHSGNPIPMTAIPTILKGLPINWGKNGKAGRFVRALKGLGWIDHRQHRYVPRGGMGKGHARRYWLGANMRHHFTEADPHDPESRTLLTPAPPSQPPRYSALGTAQHDSNRSSALGERARRIVGRSRPGRTFRLDSPRKRCSIGAFPSAVKQQASHQFAEAQGQAVLVERAAEPPQKCLGSASQAVCAPLAMKRPAPRRTTRSKGKSRIDRHHCVWRASGSSSGAAQDWAVQLQDTGGCRRMR
jgi:hypothetical protein